MPRPKPKFEDHAHYFSGLDITIPDPETYNNNTKIIISCPNGHEYKLSVNQIKNQNKSPSICPHCVNEKKKSINRLQTEVFIEYCKKYDLDFLPKKDTYDRWNDFITFKCNKCGYEHTVKTLSYWEKNPPEFVCVGCNNFKGKPESYLNDIFDHVTLKVKENNIQIPDHVYHKEPTSTVWFIIDDIKSKWDMYEYNGTRKKASFICLDCGSKKHILPLNMRGKNTQCRECFLRNQKKSVEKKLIDICKESNIYFSDEKDFSYISTTENIGFTCNSCGHTFNKTWAEITGCYYSLMCPSCNTKNKSIKENDFVDFINEIYDGRIVRNDRDTISPYELDAYLPDVNIAFEFCGNVWHSSKFIKDSSYHARKMKLCREKSIRLITIFEDEWDDKKDICKSRIKAFLNLSTNVIYARKCEIYPVDKQEAKDFLNKTHIQGSCSFDYAIGLRHNKKLVSIMTFSTTSKSKQHDVEMNRFSVDINTSVVGGFSKLLKYFKINYDFRTMATFADLRWSYGDVYQQNDMILDYEIRPRYSYVGNDTLWKRKHRFGYNKSKLVKKYGSQYSNMSEKEITEELKLYRIYDCGYLKFTFSKNTE